ncbi:MAG: extracellular solute-binding protein, partial [Treponema sp.]|nr:extracellular solute-binding protein [Treponema sp.]
MKRFLILLMAILFAGQFVFAAGGKQDGGGGAAKTVTLYTWWSESERTTGEALVADFLASHPRLKVEENYIPYNEYHSKLNTMMAADNAPDVFYQTEALINEWGEKGACADLYPYFSKAGIDPDRFHVASALFKTGNHLWGISPSIVTTCLFYNKELFRQAGVTPPPDSATNPWTWEQFVDAAKKLTKDANGYTPNDPGFNYDLIVQYGAVAPTDSSWKWLALLYAAGTTLYKENGTALEIVGPVGTDMIQKIANLSLVNRVAPTFAMTQSNAFSSLSTLLMNGQLAMFIGGTFQHPDFSNEKFDVGLAQIPSVSGKGNNMAWASGFQLRPNASQEAFELLHYLTDFNNWVEAAKNHGIALNGLPQTNSTYNDPALNA